MPRSCHFTPGNTSSQWHRSRFVFLGRSQDVRKSTPLEFGFRTVFEASRICNLISILFISQKGAVCSLLKLHYEKYSLLDLFNNDI